nr:hypothetical protein [Heyndrickxia oleronia]
MKCPSCQSSNYKVTNSRSRSSYIKRRRECIDCGERWTTVEIHEKELQVLNRVGKYPAIVMIGGKEMVLGYFTTKKEADFAVRRIYSNLKE